MTVRWLIIAALACTGCGSAMLKPPLTEGCESSGLKGCEDITEGVLAYVDGDEKKGRAALAKGAAANAPAELQAFIKVLRDLEKIPGTSAFMKPVMDVVAILEAKVEQAGGAPEQSGGGQTGAAGDGGSAAGGGGGAATSTLPERLTMTTAATDVERLRSGTVRPNNHPRISACGELLPPGEGSGRCVRLRKGPFVVTDLSVTPRCNLFVAAGNSDEGPAWVLTGDLSVHGARLLVKKGQAMVVGMVERGTDRSCSVTYAGFRPYGPGS